MKVLEAIAVEFANFLRKTVSIIRTRHGLAIWKSQEELYRRLRVFNILANEFWGGIIVPGCTVIVVMLTVGCLYCTLRLHGILHPVVYAFFPFMAVFLLAVILIGVFGQLTAVNRNARGCVEVLEMASRRLEHEFGGVDRGNIRRVLQSLGRTLRPFGVQSGSFGYIQISTQVAMLDQTIDCVILLLSW